MVSAIVYHSQTGSCKKYAHLLSAALHVPAYPDGKAPVRSDRKVIYIGWAFAGKVAGYQKAAQKFSIAAVVLVGMSPVFPDSAAKGREANGIPDDVGFYCLQGGFDSSKLPLPLRLIMKLKCKEIAARLEQKKGELSEPEKALYQMVTTGKGEPPLWDVSRIAADFLPDGGGLKQPR